MSEGHDQTVQADIRPHCLHMPCEDTLSHGLSQNAVRAACNPGQSDQILLSGPNSSKHRYLNELVSGHNTISNSQVFLLKKCG